LLLFVVLCTDGPAVFRTAFVVVAQEPLGLKDTVSKKERKKERKNLRNGQEKLKVCA